jgi:flagellar hook protein FlgE
MPNFSIPLSGLTAESTALSTIANNLSNQNTTGYKDKVVLFSDLFYQNLGTTRSGDPIQMGAGTQVSATPSLFTQGSVSSTGEPTDVAIQGAGFFAVQNASGVVNYGMPRACAELGIRRSVVPLAEIPAQVLRATRQRKRA